MNSLKDFNINELDFNNMGSWPLPIKLIAGTLVFILVMFLGYQLILSAKFDNFDAELKKEEKLKAQFESVARKARNLIPFREQMAVVRSAFEAKLKQLPRSSEVPELIDELNFAAKGLGLDINTLELSEEVAREDYVEQPVDIIVTGTYHQLAQFVSDVANMSRIITLHDFTIMFSEEEDASETGEQQLSLNIVAKFYRYDDKSDDAVAATTGGAQK